MAPLLRPRPCKTSPGNTPPARRLNKSKLEGLKKYRGLKVQKDREGVLSTGEAIVPTGVLRGRINKKWPALRTTKVKGLRNGGTKCYRNALLQCLVHLPKMYHYLGKAHQDCSLKRRECVFCALQALCQAYWNHEYVNPNQALPSVPVAAINTLQAALEYRAPGRDEDLVKDFLKNKQSDSSDLFKLILTCIKEMEDPDHESEAFAKQGQALNKDEDHPNEEAAAPAKSKRKKRKAKKVPQKKRTVALTVQDLFDMRFKRSWTCQDCSHTTTRYVEGADAGHDAGLFLDIQTPERGLTLVEYVRSNLRETLSMSCTAGDCYAGNPDKDRCRQLLLTQTPEILLFRLKRFAGKVRNGELVTEKLHDLVHFEEYLDLGEFTSQNGTCMYRLDSVLAHSGEIEEGHYVAAVREQEGRTFSCVSDDTWIRRNYRGTVMELQRPVGPGKVKFDPYMLFYSKM